MGDPDRARRDRGWTGLNFRLLDRRAGRRVRSLEQHTRTSCGMLMCVRTTVEFDPDLAAELSRRRREGRQTLREDVNRLVRLGLAREREEAQAAPATPFSTPTFDSGPPLLAIDDVEAAITRAEGDDHR